MSITYKRIKIMKNYIITWTSYFYLVMKQINMKIWERGAICWTLDNWETVASILLLRDGEHFRLCEWEIMRMCVFVTEIATKPNPYSRSILTIFCTILLGREILVQLVCWKNRFNRFNRQKALQFWYF